MDIKQKTILLVEDEALVAMLETNILKRYDYQVITADSGEQAIETVENNPGIDLVLMDINLGMGIDGTQAAEIILRNHDLPIIFLSSHTKREVVEKTEGISSYGYIVKDSGETVMITSIKMAFKLFDARQKNNQVHLEAMVIQRTRELQESEKKMQFIADTMPAAVAYVNAADLRFLFVNRVYAETFNSTPALLIGRLVSEILGEAAYTRARPYIDRTRAGERISYNNLIPVKKGQRWFNISYVPVLDETGLVKHIVVLAIDITENKAAEEEIERQLLEKETILKEVHHRIKNNIASIENLLLLQAQSITNPDALFILQDAIGRVQSMRIIYDKLLLASKYRDVSIKIYLDELIDAIINIFPDKASVSFEKNIADFPVDVRKLFPIGIIINELLTNIMKHAFAGKESGKIKIDLVNAGKHAVLTIQDNGNGLPAEYAARKGEGFGLMLVGMFSRQIGGTFTIGNRHGTRSVLEFEI